MISFKTSASHRFQLTSIDSTDSYRLSTTLNVKAEEGQITFEKKFRFIPLESPYPTNFVEKVKIPASVGFAQCQADQKCKAFVESFLKEGYKIV